MDPIIIELPVPGSPLLGPLVGLLFLFAAVRFVLRWLDLVGV